MTFKRNPDYYESGKPYVDTIESPLILEYSQQLAQLKAGNIYTMVSSNAAPPSTNIRAEDVIQLKQDKPDILIYRGDPFGFNPGNTIDFGGQPGGATPFKDERVRQALSMAYDRDLYIDVFNNVSPSRPRACRSRPTGTPPSAPAPAGGWTRTTASSARTRSTSSTTSPKPRSCSLPPATPTASRSLPATSPARSSAPTSSARSKCARRWRARPASVRRRTSSTTRRSTCRSTATATASSRARLPHRRSVGRDRRGVARLALQVRRR